MKSDLDLKTYERTIYERIDLFIQHFHAVSDKLEDEEDVKSSIIDEFLKILGWNLQDHLEVKKEQKVEGRTRADYALKVDGKPKVYIEAKSLNKDLEKGFDETSSVGKRTYIEQTINYAYNSGVNWALLTNGKRWILFNAYWKGTHKNRIAFDLEIDDFLKDNNFDKIKLLAKEYVVTGKLDEYFKERPFRRPVDEEVVSFLLECRRALTESVIKNNEGKDTTDRLREGIHRILDRLVFYKICEDRDILDYGRIKKTFDIFREDKSSQSFVIGLKSYYDWFNRIYDGELFGPHFCEDFIVDNDVYKMIIDGLYQYDFATIDVDILGKIYENYLGNTLQDLEKGLRWVVDKEERKKFGQYYTPQYVVDYIIDNVGITRDSKILDPACGSGAFLIKAYDKLKLLNQERIKRIIQRKKHNLSEEAFKKWEKEELPKIEEESINQILTRNIHGVDLNPESVELTKVNLWLRSIRKDTPLNKLENNIACGNSLISGAEEELKQYFGDDWKEKRPFNWEEGFPQVLQNGGFDVVIGNPPYGAELSGSDRKYISNNYTTGASYKNTALIFIEQSLKLLKDGGYFGMIVPKSLAFSQRWRVGRELIISDLTKIVDVSKAFKDVLLEQVIIVLRRGAGENKYEIQTIESAENKSTFIEKKYVEATDSLIVHDDIRDLKIFQKMNSDCIYLGDICKTSRGLPFQKHLVKTKSAYNVLRGKNIARYFLREGNEFLDDSKIDENDEKIRFLKQPKVISQRIVAHVTRPTDHIIIMSMIDEDGTLTVDTIENTIVTDDRYSLKFILSLLNSKLISWYAYRYIFAKAIRTMDLDDYYIGKIPIPKKVVDQSQFAHLADHMIAFNKQLNSINTNFFDYVNLHPKVKDTDLGYYFNQLNMSDKKVLNNANGIKGKVKKVKVREEGEWFIISVDYGDENKDLIENFDVLKCQFENPNFTKFIKHCILNYRKSISKGNLLERILKIDNIPIFDNRDKARNQQIVDEVMDSFLPALERKRELEREVEETDRTIDELVYELYGLTEEEVRIVEGV